MNVVAKDAVSHDDGIRIRVGLNKRGQRTKFIVCFIKLDNVFAKGQIFKQTSVKSNRLSTSGILWITLIVNNEGCVGKD